MLERFLKPQAEATYAAMRTVLGTLITFHGAQKMFGAFGREAAQFGSQMWAGGLIEFLGGLAIAFGLWTRAFAFLVSGTMAVAYTQFHWKLEGGAALLPIVNRGELALAYAFVFLFIACHGPGRWSVDAALAKSRKK